MSDWRPRPLRTTVGWMHGPRTAALAAGLAIAATAAGALAGAAAARAGGCDTPLTYDVAAMDPRHTITRAGFVALLRRSEPIWEAASGKDLFRFEPGGKVRVHLIFDGRQVLENRIQAADRALEAMKAALAEQKAAIAANAAKLKPRKNALAKRIAHWNAKGGAPRDIFAELEAETAAVNKLVAASNAEVRRYNAAVARQNAAVKARNALARSRGTDEKQLGKAQLGGTKVEIYVLSGAAKDENLIAHEFGHILGIKHVPGRDNLMNPVLAKPLTRASAADLAALAAVCAKG